MYLFVFVMLLSSILGLYTQVFMLQTSRMMSRQTAIADIMLTWHGAVYSLSKDRIADGTSSYSLTTVDETGCLITRNPQNALANSPSVCLGTDARITYNSGTSSYTPTGYLPTDYDNDGFYRWYSIIYAPGGVGTQRYVITFAVPSVAANSNSLISQPTAGLTISELWQQIKNSRAPKTNYGYVNGSSKFVTPDAPLNSGSVRQYDVPKTSAGAAIVTEGSVGFITPL